jgi:hypothetical protein
MTLPGSVTSILALGIGAVVLCGALAVFAVVWEQAWFALIAAAVGLGERVGVVSSDPSQAATKPPNGKRDAGFLAFNRLLRWFCRLIPGDPNRHPHTFILPMMVLGIPAFMLALTLYWAIPLYLFSLILGLGDGAVAGAAAFFGTFAYIGVATVALKTLVSLPGRVRRSVQSV